MHNDDIDLYIVRGKYETVKIPPMHMWVEGDNSKESVDSNKLGPVSISILKIECYLPSDSC